MGFSVVKPLFHDQRPKGVNLTRAMEKSLLRPFLFLALLKNDHA